MARRSTSALGGIQSAMFDPNGMGENMATFGRAQQEENQAYTNADPLDKIGLSRASLMEDPGMKVFLQALHEKNATISPHGGFMASPFEIEQRSTFDPSFQTSAVDPATALAGLSKRRGK